MSWSYAVFVLITVGLTAFIGYGTFATARLLRSWQPAQNPLLTPAENFMRVLIILLCIGLGYLSDLDWAVLGWRMAEPLREVGIGALVGLGLALFFSATTQWIVRQSGDRFYSALLLQHIVPRSGHEFLLILAALIPVVLLEEILFRSLLLGGLSPLLPASVLLITLGVIFGLLHNPQGMWGMIGAGLGGVIFGVLFLWQGSLLAPLVAHYVANAVQIALVWRGSNGR